MNLKLGGYELEAVWSGSGLGSYYSKLEMSALPKILFLVSGSLLFVALLNSIPTYLLNFKCFFLYMLSIHNNFSAGTQIIKLQALVS